MNLPSALVVEDDLEVQALLRDFCEEAGFQVATANDGRTAQDWLESHVPALVVLDLSIPLVTGLDLLAWMRRPGSNLDAVPVVLTSGTDERDLRDLARLFGATAVLPKPLTLPRLLEVLSKFTATAGC